MKKIFASLMVAFALIITACTGATSSEISSSISSSVSSSESSSVESSSSEIVTETVDVYFYNADAWTAVYAYTFADDEGTNVETLGAWPGTATVDAGEGWFKIAVPLDVTEQPFNVIFNNNNNGKQVPAAFIADEVNVYVNAKGNLFDSKEEAVADQAIVENTKIYFYNSNSWATPTAYGWGTGLTDPLGGWPGTVMTDEGEGWFSIVYPHDASTQPINIIVTGGQDNPRSEVFVNTTTNVYLTVNSNVSFDSKEAAEASLIVEEVTRVYFYNSAEWATVSAYAYYFDEAEAKFEPLGGWAGRDAVDEGAGWWYVDVPVLAETTNFSLIFNDKGSNQSAGAFIETSTSVYTTLTEVFDTKAAAVASITGEPVVESTKVYFYNSDNWTAVNAHVWAGEELPFTGWPGAAATDEGNSWWSIVVPFDAVTKPFNVIFNNNNNGLQSGGAYIQSSTGVYVTVTADGVFESQAAAVASITGEPVVESTKVYFYNSNNWTAVNVHAYTTSGNVFGDWPGAAATDEGNGWWSIEVPLVAETTPFNVIFNNNNNGLQSGGAYIQSSTNVYVTVIADGVFASQEAAIASLTA